MKEKLFFFCNLVIIFILLLTLSVCTLGGDIETKREEIISLSHNPTADDYDITNLTQTFRSLTNVTITPKTGKSSGDIIILYNGSTTLPVVTGTHAVTFNVKAARGWNAASGLAGGTLTISSSTPVASDFNIGYLTQTVGSVTPVTITPKAGRSNGAITVLYDGTQTLPSAAGTYTITFNVEAAIGWNAVNGLAGGTLTINAENQNPTAADFDIDNLTQTVGSVTHVTITQKDGKSNGIITVLYNGSQTLPSAAGTYTVTFNVAAAAGWNAASGLAGGTLTIYADGVNLTPFNDDFYIGNLTQTVGSVTPVTITPKAGKSNGIITVFYNGSQTLPTTAGTYTVTFNVEAAAGWNSAYGLAGGTLILFELEIITYTSGITMSRIPAGTYTRGSNDYASPPHQVTLTKGFYMGIYAVTQEQYQTVTGVDFFYFRNSPASGEVQERRPVEYVSWYDAVEFCNKLSEQEGLMPAYTITGRSPTSGYSITGATVTVNWNANGYRLPTEAEWEYACRAGTTTTYNTGDTISDNTGWYSSNGGSMTHEVGLKPPNAWGLYDMHGNVWEWCWDWYGSYTSGAQTDPVGASSGSDRVNRGGSWGNSAAYGHSADRHYNNPALRNIAVGFRVVRP